MAGANHGENTDNDATMDTEIEPVAESTNENNENVVEEYNQLDSKLDQLNSALDFIEQKNDDIHQQLRALLQSSIEIRQQLANDNVKNSDNH